MDDTEKILTSYLNSLTRTGLVEVQNLIGQKDKREHSAHNKRISIVEYVNNNRDTENTGIKQLIDDAKNLYNSSEPYNSSSDGEHKSDLQLGTRSSTSAISTSEDLNEHNNQYHSISSNTKSTKQILKDNEPRSQTSQPISEVEFTIFSHNIKDLTDSLKDLGKVPEDKEREIRTIEMYNYDQRISNIVESYISDEWMFKFNNYPDIIAVQEIMTRGKDTWKVPIKNLAETLTDKVNKKGFEYQGKVTDHKICDRELGAFIWNKKKFNLIEIDFGLPFTRTKNTYGVDYMRNNINNIHLFDDKGKKKDRNNSSSPEQTFGLRDIFNEEELQKHAFVNITNKPLFKRLPTYGLFQLVENKDVYVLVCSVHLASKSEETSNELSYLCDLLHHNPEHLYKEKKVFFILCGDLNLQGAKANHYTPINNNKTKKRYNYGLQPYYNYYTNLGQEYLKTAKSMCYDNFIVPNFTEIQMETETHICSLPQNFINQVLEKYNNQQLQVFNDDEDDDINSELNEQLSSRTNSELNEQLSSGVSTRGIIKKQNKTSLSHIAFYLYSDHRAICMKFKLPVPQEEK